jgi:hypothetical protein
MSSRFAAARFLREYLNGARRVHEVLSRYERRVPSVSAIEKWYERDAIPGVWFPIVLSAIEREKGAPVSLTRYIKQQADNEDGDPSS